MEYIVKILDIEDISENIKKIKIEKPKNYTFISGQHTLISINKTKLEDKKRPFSFSSSDKDGFLEFIIKIYNERNGITKEFNNLKVKDELIIGEPKGKISYKGKGVFIAAGTGITPFISIIKSLNEKNEQKIGNFLIYSNGTKNQIILEKELKKLFNNNAIFILSREKKAGYESGHINKKFLRNKIKDFTKKFYLCGPFKLVFELKKILIELGAKQENIISEI
ncbi:MAG: FAD-binding oxidoreductase [Nanoarchaeota archaeon]